MKEEQEAKRIIEVYKEYAIIHISDVCRYCMVVDVDYWQRVKTIIENK